MASPADGIVARALGGVIRRDADRAGPASYDEHGTRFVFVPAPGDRSIFAIDVEATTSSMPQEIVSRLGVGGSSEAFRRWTEAEVAAKLLDIPVLALLTGRQFPADALQIVRADTQHYWIAVGKRV